MHSHWLFTLVFEGQTIYTNISSNSLIALNLHKYYVSLNTDSASKNTPPTTVIPNTELQFHGCLQYQDSWLLSRAQLHFCCAFLRDPISVLGIFNPHSFESVLCLPDLLTPACTYSFDTHYHWYIFVFIHLYSFILIHIYSYLHRFNLHHMCLSSLV